MLRAHLADCGATGLILFVSFNTQLRYGSFSKSSEVGSRFPTTLFTSRQSRHQIKPIDFFMQLDLYFRMLRNMIKKPRKSSS